MTNKFVFNRIAIDNLTITEAVEKINKMIVQCEKGYIFTVNAAHFLYLRNDSQFLEAYNSCSLILADGMSLVFASKLLGKVSKDVINKRVKLLVKEIRGNKKIAN